MPNELAEARYQVALANRMLANEGVLDAFGHVSLRHPADPGRYLLSRSRSPGLIEPDDMLEYTLDSAPVKPPDGRALRRAGDPRLHLSGAAGCDGGVPPPFSGRACRSALPACPIVPVFHLGAAGGETVPFWNQHDEFGDTNLLVVKPEEGESLARALGSARRRADEQSWGDRGRARSAGTGVALRSSCARTPNISSRHSFSARWRP